MTPGARGWGILIVVTTSVVLMLGGLAVGMTCAPIDGRTILAIGLEVAGGFLLGRLVTVQKRAVEHISDNGTRYYSW